MPETKYKHTTYFKRADLERKVFVHWSPSIREWRDIIEDYIYISKKRKNNKLSMFKLQMELISDLIRLNDALKGYIKLFEDPEERKIQFPDTEITPDIIDYWEKEIFNHKVLINAIKDVGDGIAWRIFDYDRAIIYNMCVNNEDPGPLTLTDGFVIELHSLGDFTNETDIKNFIYHGITNFLLISDLTLLYGNGEKEFVEVKSGKRGRGKSWKERLERQKERAENIAKIANTDEGISSNVETKFRYIDKKPETIINKLDTLLKRSNDNLVVTQIFSSYLGVGVVNFAMLVETESDSWQEKLDKLKNQIKKDEKDFVMIHSSIDWNIFSPNKAPLSIHPFTPEVIANILLGKYIVNYVINITQFLREFEKKGWKATNIISERSPESEDKSMFTLKKGSLSISIPPLLYSRAIYEGLSVDSIILELEDILKSGPKDKKYALFYGFTKEKFLWE